jgi:hypothetical protein
MSAVNDSSGVWSDFDQDETNVYSKGFVIHAEELSPDWSAVRSCRWWDFVARGEQASHS